MENIKYERRREGRWTPIRAKAQDTGANPNSWETHLVRKRWDIGLLRALSPRIMMMMMMPVSVWDYQRLPMPVWDYHDWLPMPVPCLSHACPMPIPVIA